MNHTVEEPTTALEVLQKLHPTSSKTTLRKMLTQGRVLVNDEVIHRAKHAVEVGDVVELLGRQRAEERTPAPNKLPPIDLDVLFEDDTLLVVNKPLTNSQLQRINWKRTRCTAVVWNTSVARMSERGATLFIVLTEKLLV